MNKRLRCDRCRWTLVASFAMAWLPSILSAQVTVDFESLPVPPEGYFNGDVDGESIYRERFSVIGSRDNFGEPETLQLWDDGGLGFFNGYTRAYDSWNGFSWSNVVDTTTAGFSNQYAAFPGGGSDGAGGVDAGGTYAMAFGDASYVDLPEQTELVSVDLANGTYSALAMLEGDGFSKRFGGASGNDEDLFQVTLTGYDQLGGTGTVVGTVDHILADYRFFDNSLDQVQSDWVTVDLSGLRGARSVGLSFFSTDSGSFGINTPAYVATDRWIWQAASVPEPVGLAGSGLAAAVAGLWRRRRQL